MPINVPPPDTAPLECDLLVMGSGAGGLSAAVVAAHLGLKVIVAEKEAHFGGTTAWSGGWMWLPRNALAVAAGIAEPMEKPLSYLRHELGAQFDEARVLSFLNAAPEMVDFFRTNTALQFIDGNAIPDFHGHSPDAGTGGRSLCAAAFDGKRLGEYFKLLKPPLHETTLWGMQIASGAEMRHFFNATRSFASFKYVAKLLVKHLRDGLVHGRSTRLVNGNALVAALAASLLSKGGKILLSSSAVQLLSDEQRVTGAVLKTERGSLRILARRGVLLACGGFPHDAARKAQLLPHAPTSAEHYSAGARSNTGDGLRLGESAGGRVALDLHQAAALAPVSLVPRTAEHADGGAPEGVAHFPHLIERGKPGLIAVTAQGQRFTNEANAYHDVMQDLLAATPAGRPHQAWLICDHAFIRRYGLGAVKPFPFSLRPWLGNGYLQRGKSLHELAAACAIDATQLQATVERYNTMCPSGNDADFHKGATAYNRMQGDAQRAAELGSPNPCMAALQQAPYYAVRIVMGSLGTFAGLRVDEHSRVLDAADQPIAGLYANGNDMASVMGGHYPAGGITLGPAMTFGYLAAKHIAHPHPSRLPEGEGAVPPSPLGRGLG